MNPLLLNGTAPRWPLRLCPYCASCGAAVDQNGNLVYDGGRVGAGIDWVDVQNTPGWASGWPPGTVGVGGPKPLLPWSGYRPNLANAFDDAPPLTEPAGARCECGSESVYGSGAGHSSWCPKAVAS